ncbi:efflux RND transporter permease subunit, partial [Microvirga sp. 3-52]|nr:efflux RND transporter permease subunit [Microvirga sp. 3-52]
LDSTLSLTQVEDINQLPVVVNEEIVPLSAIAKLERLMKPTSVLRKDGNEYLRISVEVNSGDLSGIANEITMKTAHLTLPEGVILEAGGAASVQNEQFMELFQLMAVSIGLVYLIMVLTFKTLRAPLVILFTLPLAMIGAILGLLIARTPIDIGAMLGALMLIGIVVTNAIVLLDRVRQNEEKMPIREALLEAGATRFR